MNQQTSAIQELERQKMLLEIEYYSEKEAFRKQTESIGTGDSPLYHLYLLTLYVSSLYGNIVKIIIRDRKSVV